MGKQKIFEIARKKDAVEKDLKEFTRIKKEAFEIFNGYFASTLENIQKSYDSGAWYELRCWQDDYERHCCFFCFENPMVIPEAFGKLLTADINRKEFSEMLSGCCNDIEKYIEELTEELQSLQQQLNKAYYDFLENETGEHKWIFEQPFVKNLVLKFLLSESETE